jgi:hypothetical protein
MVILLKTVGVTLSPLLEGRLGVGMSVWMVEATVDERKGDDDEKQRNIWNRQSPIRGQSGLTHGVPEAEGLSDNLVECRLADQRRATRML